MFLSPAQVHDAVPGNPTVSPRGIDRIARWGVDLVGLDYCSIYPLHNGQARVTPAAVAFTAAIDESEGRMLLDGAQVRQHLAEHGSTWYTAAGAMPPAPAFFTAIFSGLGCQTGAIVPITVGERVLGCLVAGRKGYSEFDYSTSELLTVLATTAGLALQQLEQLRAVRELYGEISSLKTIISSLARGDGLETVLKVIIQQAIRLTGSEDALVLLLAEEQEWFEVCASRGPGLNPLKAERITVGHSLNGLVIATQQPVISNDVPNDQRADQARVELLGVRSVTIVPMKLGSEVIGTIAVHNKRDGAFTQNDAETLKSFADQAALAIENARLMEALADARADAQDRHQKLQTLLGHILDMQEEERRRIALDIHDLVLPLFAGAGYKVQAGIAECSDGDADIKQQLHEAESLLNQAMSEMRQAIYEVWPATLDEIGLVAALEELLDHLAKSTRVRPNLKILGDADRLAPANRLVVYRVIQEALTNIQRHAHASAVRVALRFGLRNARIVVEDDGRGFDPEAISLTSERHLGLLGMRERAYRVGGELEIASRPGFGCRITLVLPLDKV